MQKVGFLVNPVAGCGVSLNMIGSDSLSSSSCFDSVSVKTATRFLGLIHQSDLIFLTSSSQMGEDSFKEAGIENYSIIYEPEGKSEPGDTIAFLEELRVQEPDLLIFFGGDGTAAIISSFPWDGPVLAVPAGTKMFSSVFSINLERAVEIFNTWMKKSYPSTRWGEVVDIGDDTVKNKEFRTELKGYLKIPDSENIVRFSKAEFTEQHIEDLIDCFVSSMDRGNYVIGPGSTCKSILSKLGLEGTLYGFDIITDLKLAKKDATREDILHCEEGTRMVLSPLGSQGFLIGRGNRQINGDVMKKIGFHNIRIISSQRKIQPISSLFIDIPDFTGRYPEYMKVETGCGSFKVVRVRT